VWFQFENNAVSETNAAAIGQTHNMRIATPRQPCNMDSLSKKQQEDLAMHCYVISI
jgi:hypothetical protein